jgi:hypothetical protein
MNSATSPIDIPEFRDFAFWLVALLVLFFGGRLVRETVAFVLDKLYDLFIQHNP